MEAVDEFDRRLSVRGDAVSRHWRGHGGDSLVHWTWNDGVEGWGEDQSYFSRAQWERTASGPPELAAESAHGAGETVVQSGDGRDVMTRPVGATKVSSSLAFPFMDQPALCSR